MVGESNQNVFLTQIDASRYAEFECPSSRYRESTVASSSGSDDHGRKYLLQRTHIVYVNHTHNMENGRCKGLQCKGGLLYFTNNQGLSLMEGKSCANQILESNKDMYLYHYEREDFMQETQHK